jgi:subtilase family serine protease
MRERTVAVRAWSRRRRSRWKVAAVGVLAAAVVAGIGGASSARSGAITRAADAATATIPARGYSPQTVQRAYGVSPLLREGIDGRGETVVLPETLPPGGGTSIRRAVAAFDKRNHLAPVDLTLGRALGFTGDTSLATGEEVQDVEMVQTIAPGATIKVMRVPFRAFAFPARLASVLRAAAGRGNVVSFSQSECETKSCLSAAQLRSLNRALRYARDRHVSVFASSGDTGAATGDYRHSGDRGVRAPASSPLVTGVGGSRLTVHADGAYASESVWNDDVHHPISTGARLSAGGGGVSARYARPAYQDGLPTIGDHRGVPDVAAVAKPGMATVLVIDGHAHTYPGGGTSESAPLWAGIAALADQDAHRQLGFLNAGLYRIGHSTQYHRAFHDITQGDNTVTLLSGKNLDGYSARPGWDAATGWGSPNAQVLVPLLGKAVRPDDGQGL